MPVEPPAAVLRTPLRGLPELPPGMLPRERLTREIERAGTRPLVLVQGAAGSGKSVAVSAWAREQRSSRPVAWLSCGPAVRGGNGFLAEFLAALDLCRPQQSSAPGPPAGIPVSREEQLDRLLSEMSGLPAGGVLVLDDYDRMPAPHPRDDIPSLLERLPPGLTVVIVTRTAPTLGLYRARVEGRLGEVPAEDLAFTLEETRLFLARNRLPLGDAAVRTIHERTKGWAAALRLTTISLARADDPGEVVDHLSGTHETISGYLTEQVLDTLDEADRELLLDTCVSDVLTEPLVEVLDQHGGGWRRLREVAGRVGFLTPTAAEGYHYHPMFAQLLRSELADADPKRLAGQHIKAAQWALSSGAYVPALRHAVASGDWELVPQAVSTATLEYVLGGRLPELAAQLEELPQTLVTTDPRVMTARGITLVFENRPQRAAAVLEAARSALPVADDPTTGRARAVWSYARSVLARYHGDTASVLEALPAGGPDIPGPDSPTHEPTDRTIRAAWAGGRAAGLMWDDQFAEATANAELAREEVRAGAPGWPAVTALGVLSFVAALEGRLDTADRFARELAELMNARHWSDAPYIAIGDLASGWAAIERLDLDGARAAVRRAESRHARLTGHFVSGMISVLKGRLSLVSDGDPGAAREWLDHWADGLPLLSSRVIDRARQVVLVESALALGDLDRAQHLADAAGSGLPVLVAARRGRHLVRADGKDLNAAADAALGCDRGLRLRTLLAVASTVKAMGDAYAADRLLNQALDITELDGFRLPFVQQAETVHALLVDAPLSASQHGPLVAELLGVTASTTDGYPDLVAPLTAREVEILHHLVAGVESDDIATLLGISRNTVRTHIKSVYRKLSAQSRREAVRRASALGII